MQRSVLIRTSRFEVLQGDQIVFGIVDSRRKVFGSRTIEPRRSACGGCGLKLLKRRQVPICRTDDLQRIERWHAWAGLRKIDTRIRKNDPLARGQGDMQQQAL